MEHHRLRVVILAHSRRGGAENGRFQSEIRRRNRFQIGFTIDGESRHQIEYSIARIEEEHEQKNIPASIFPEISLNSFNLKRRSEAKESREGERGTL